MLIYVIVSYLVMFGIIWGSLCNHNFTTLNWIVSLVYFAFAPITAPVIVGFRLVVT